MEAAQRGSLEKLGDPGCHPPLAALALSLGSRAGWRKTDRLREEPWGWVWKEERGEG